MVDIEDKLTGDIWRGDYQQKYIEEIAAKAGSAKTFPVFFKMLQTAVQRLEQQTIYLDMLT